MRAVMLHVLDVIDAEGAGAETSEGPKDQTAGDAGTPRRTTVDFLHTRYRVLTTYVALEEHGH